MTRRILITGSAVRLGAAIARAVHAVGMQPVIHYRSSTDEAQALAKDLGTVAVEADLSDGDAAAGLIDKAASAAGGPIGGLVNNASIFEHDRPETVSEDALISHFRANTMGPVLLARAFAAHAEGHGGLQDPCVVNILDQKLRNLHPDHFSYTLSKAALETATLTMAQGLAPKVRVCGVAPGYNLPAPGESDAAFAAKAADVNALSERLHPDEVAQTVLFCLLSRATTGQVILADKGEHLVCRERDISREDEG